MRFDRRRYRTAWISDVHLGFRGCSAEHLLHFLRSTECEYLYLVGDIIDIGSMKKRPFRPQAHNDVVRTNLGKAKHGTKVVFVPGIHDALLRDYDGMVFESLLSGGAPLDGGRPRAWEHVPAPPGGYDAALPHGELDPPMPNAQRRMERSDRPRLLIAVGGNAIHPGRGPGTVEEQREYAARTGRALLPIMRTDNELVITHGNGPVVGKILMRQVLSRERVPPMSMDVCVAHSQGGIAYLLMQSLENTLREAGNDRHVVCLLTQVEVDADDPAFGNPTKPIGFFYDEAEARTIAESLGWTMRDDAGRGWRCVVPSPRPKHIVDISLIEAVAKSGAVVIAGGGGGIPVVRDANGVRRGVEGVIDKDLSSAHMAQVLGIRDFMILTSVDRVQIGFGTPRARSLDEVRVDELRRHFEAGEFAEGSMGPKVEAAIRFIDGGGQRAVIAHLDAAEAALAGEAGTQILP